MNEHRLCSGNPELEDRYGERSHQLLFFLWKLFYFSVCGGKRNEKGHICKNHSKTAQLTFWGISESSRE